MRRSIVTGTESDIGSVDGYPCSMNSPIKPPVRRLVLAAAEQRARLNSLLTWLEADSHPVHAIIRVLMEMGSGQPRDILTYLLRDRTFKALLEGRVDEILVDLRRAEHGITG